MTKNKALGSNVQKFKFARGLEKGFSKNREANFESYFSPFSLTLLSIAQRGVHTE